MPLERNDVGQPLWRKKVDGSLLRHNVTPIPGWVARMWAIPQHFPGRGGRRLPESQVELRFRGERFNGAVTWSRETSKGADYRLFFDDGLRAVLNETFVMSSMRDLEGRLRALDGDTVDVEQEIPFWEFLDIEFDAEQRIFDLRAHYLQRPSFPSLFRRMADAPPLKRMRDQLGGKPAERIHKQHWKARREFESEIGATNVIYMLADTVNGLLYIGEAVDLVARLRRGHPIIGEWTHYRYDLLPAALAPLRVQLERMVIRDFDALIGVSAAGLPGPVSSYRLVNLKVDR